MKKFKLYLCLFLVLLCGACNEDFIITNENEQNISNEIIIDENAKTFIDEYGNLHYKGIEIPKWNELSPYYEVNNNKPFFTEEELKLDTFESYSELDELDRVGVAFANLSFELMPDDKRESIGMVKPSGWNQGKYEDLIKDKYLYNRCHLIGFQLAGENANVLNLCTGTRYMNVEGMLPFENRVADYIKDTFYQVLYRVTPIFVDDELVCRGVLIEAQSTQDDDCVFNVFCYNVQPGIEINYKDGSNKRK